jgi:excisionase family DNA binding protein
MVLHNPWRQAMLSVRILDDDEHMTFEEGAKLLKVSMSTFRRYWRGELEFMRTGPKRGGRYLTSREAIHRYLAKLNGQAEPDPVESSPGRTTKRRQQELASVDRDLEAAGY